MRRLLHALFLHSGREERASRLLRTGASVGMLAMVIISFTAVNLQALLWQSSHWLVSTVLPSVVVELTNEERAGLSEQPLSRNSVLDEAARLKAEDMAKNQYFAHFSPAGVSPWHWFDEAGYVYAHAGENLAIHFSDSGEVMEAWMKSPTHRANIVSTNYTEIGVGTAKGMYEGYETVFVVQLFGSPADMSQVVASPTVVTTPEVVTVPTPPAIMMVETKIPSAATGTSEVVKVASEVLAAPAGSSASSTTDDAEVLGTTASTTAVAEVGPVTTPEMVPVLGPAGVLENGTVIKAPKPENPDPVFAVAAMEVDQDTVSVYSDMMATSSGYPMYTRALGEASGTTKMAMIGRLATQPSFVLQTVYLTLGSIVALMLVLSLLLGLRSERPWQIIYSVALLVVMGGLVTIHVYLTAGAVVA